MSGRLGCAGPRARWAAVLLVALATACTTDFTWYGGDGGTARDGGGDGGDGGGGGGGGGGGSSDGGDDGGSDGSGAADATPTGGSCDLVGQTGCAATQKCAWIYTNPATGDGAPGCYANGAIAVGAPCTEPASAGEADDCVRGAHCTQGACREICRTSPPSPCSSGSCTAPDGLAFEICLPSCDPLAQNCPAGQGCYLSTTGPICAAVLPPGKPPGGPCEWSNECLPGSGCFEGYGPRMCRAYCNYALYPSVNDPAHCAPFERCWSITGEPVYGACAP